MACLPIRWILVSAWVVTLPALPAHGQTFGGASDSLRRTFVEIEGAQTTPDYDLSGQLSVTHVRGWHAFSLRGSFAGDVVLDGVAGPSEFAFFYGPAFSWAWGQVRIGTGVSVTWGEQTDGSPRRTVPGLPFDAYLYLVPPTGYGTIGVTVGGFANVNEEQSFAGVSVGIVIGRLR